jgi:putative MATE family efflux protein
MKHNMLTDSPTKTLIIFSLPILLGNLLQQFYSIIDSIIVGNFVSANALGSIGNTMPIVFMVICISFGLSNGASILIGQTVGANSLHKIKTLSYSSVFYAMVVGVGLSLVFVPNAMNLVKIINTPIELQQDSANYLSIYFLGLVFIFGFNMISSIFRSLGDSTTPLLFLIVASILNIILDLVFVLVFQMGVQGVAIATVLAQALAFFLQVILFNRRLRKYHTDNKKIVELKSVLQLTRLALPTTSQEILISVGIVLTQVLVNRFGSEVVSAYAITSKISEFVMLPMINLGIGMTVFTAQNVGAFQFDRVKSAYINMLKITLGFGIIMAILVILFANSLITLFLGNNLTQEILEVGRTYLYYSAVTFIFMAILFPAESLLKGAGDIHMFLFIAITGSFTKILAALLLIPSFGVQGIWFGIAFGWFIETVLTLYRYRSNKWIDKRLKEI